jgi:hypothetical protein
MEQALYIYPILASTVRIQRASAVLPFVSCSLAPVVSKESQCTAPSASDRKPNPPKTACTTMAMLVFCRT